jgi:uncharacterized protein (TIGR02246 family)
MRICTSICLATLLLAGCDKAPIKRTAVNATEAAAIAELAEGNFTAGKVEAIMDQYADDAVMIDAAAPNPSADRKVQTGWAQTFVSMKPADYRVRDRHIQLLGPDAFISSGVEVFTVGAGAARPTVSARFTDVFQRKADGRWKIVHEHVSMPPVPTDAP